ncbi:MAG: glycosyltransferase family 4 protein [Burkholderiales bacterium]
MRVLIVSQYFWPESFRINDLALGLKQRGHIVEVLTAMPNYPSGHFLPGYGCFTPASELYEGIPVKRIPIVARGSRRSWQLAANYASFILSASLLGPLRCRGNYDVVFVYEPSPVTVALPGLVMKALKRAPLLFWVQDLWPESLSATGAVQSPWVLRQVRKLVDFIYRRCDHVLVSSKGFTGHVAASGLNKQRISHVPNWAESLYRPLDATPVSVLAELPPGFKVMFAGNIGSAQSFETILAAADKLRAFPEIQWIVLGDGHLKPWVEEQVRQYGLERQFHLLGQRPMESMPGYFSAADALLVTLRASPVFALTVPSKVQSCLACGRPIIAALNGEGADIVMASGAGLACPAEDPERLAETVLSLYKMSHEERQAMGRNGRAYFEAHFERELVIGKIEQLMNSATREYTCAS